MKKARLLITDIDNTLFDWVNYFVPSMEKLVDEVSSTVHVSKDVLASQIKMVLTERHSIEYPFLIQELPSVRNYYGNDCMRMLDECVERGRKAFKKEAQNHLKPYDGVIATLESYRKAGVPVVALTDAPRYVAMWRLKKIGLLHYFDGIYGLMDPEAPVGYLDGREVVLLNSLVHDHIKSGYLFDFKGKSRNFPVHWEKPAIEGFSQVLDDFCVPSSKEILWVGDNQRKDVALGVKAGVTTAWAKYGAFPCGDKLTRLRKFSPDGNVRRNANLGAGEKSDQPDLVIESFEEIKKFI